MIFVARFNVALMVLMYLCFDICTFKQPMLLLSGLISHACSAMFCFVFFIFLAYEVKSDPLLTHWRAGEADLIGDL